MRVILWLGIFYTIYGFAGLLGLQNIPEKYKGKDWTKRYIRAKGISWLMIGIPWIVLYCNLNGKDIEKATVMILIILCGIPSVLYSYFNSRKYNAILRSEKKR